MDYHLTPHLFHLARWAQSAVTRSGSAHTVGGPHGVLATSLQACGSDRPPMEEAERIIRRCHSQQGSADRALLNWRYFKGRCLTADWKSHHRHQCEDGGHFAVCM